jgi:hypothetical protein
MEMSSGLVRITTAEQKAWEVLTVAATEMYSPEGENATESGDAVVEFLPTQRPTCQLAAY